MVEHTANNVNTRGSTVKTLETSLPKQDYAHAFGYSHNSVWAELCAQSDIIGLWKERAKILITVLTKAKANYSWAVHLV